jgi:protein TonB
LLIGALIASLVAHVLLLTGSAFSGWLHPQPMPEAAPLVLNLRTTPERSPDALAAPRLAEQNSNGGGNTLQPEQRQTTTQIGMAASADEPAPVPTEHSAAPQAAQRMTRDMPSPARISPAIPGAAQQDNSTELDTATLLAQAQQLAGRSGDSDVRNNAQETGRIKAEAGRNARKEDWAYYMDDWRRKMENIGRFNFPEEANQRGIYGGPVLSVEIRDDGKLLGVQVIKGSGYPFLDEAAKRIVKMSEPFAPFPPVLASRYSSYKFRYKWNFTTDSQLSVQ